VLLVCFRVSTSRAICILSRKDKARVIKYIDKIKEERAATNRKNKRHGSDMERRIAKKLDGHRVPMSGSGALKSDIIVNSFLGMYLVECKYSDATSGKIKKPVMSLNFCWLEKLNREVVSMKAKFGILVMRMAHARTDLVVIDTRYMSIIAPSLDFSAMPVIELKGKMRSIDLELLKKAMNQVDPPSTYVVMRSAILDITCLVMYMDTYLNIMENTQEMLNTEVPK
jgi:Holliday junction resolvase